LPAASDIVAHIDRLASLPSVYIRVKRVIDDPNASLAQLAEAMATDTAMTARVLRVVNSPFYGFPGRIETLTRALNILGMQQVHDVVLAWAISSAFADLRSSVLSMKEVWRNSVARAIAARELARHARFVDKERLFVEGLLSNIGHLVLYVVVPDLALQAIEASRGSGRPLPEVEREIIGCDYAEVGVALVSAWGLPQTFAEPIACQIEPAAATTHRLEAAMLHIAGVLAESIPAPGAQQPDPSALAALELDEAALEGLREQVDLELDGVVATFFPNLAAA
jgi:HD-like signal output (HDOD) protein